MTVEIIGRLTSTGESVRLRMRAGRIAAIESVEATDEDLWVAPGFVDLQVNGYDGHDVNAPNVGPADIEGLIQVQWRAGVTAFCPTVVTGPETTMIAAMRTVAQVADADRLYAHTLAGIHVEGPHLAADDGPRGAHDRRWLRSPDRAEFDRWMDAADGRIAVVTLAPELPGAEAYIRHLTAAGVVAAIGHTAADPATIERAVEAGARLSTHLGNGTYPTLPRHPNHMWTQLADDRLSASVIADGHHLPLSVLTAFVRTKGVERTILISDTVALAGRPAGSYTTPVGGQVAVTGDGRIVLPGTSLLAGAYEPLHQGLAHILRVPGAKLADAVRMCTANPARLLGLTRDDPVVGAGADLTVFRLVAGQISVQRTVVDGTVVA